MNAATVAFRSLAQRCVDSALAADPQAATKLGEHRFDDRLTCMDNESWQARVLDLEDQLTELDAIDDADLDTADLVDLEVLRARLLSEAFYKTECRENEWNPLVWDPGDAVHTLLVRHHVPRQEQATNVEARVAAIPDQLSTARTTLMDMPAVHVETAIERARALRKLVETTVRDFFDSRGAVIPPNITQVGRAVQEYEIWLTDRLPECTRSPRLDQRTYAGVLWHALDDETGANALLRDAEAHLEDVTARMRSLASEYLGESEHAPRIVSRALATIATESPANAVSVLAIMRQAVAKAYAYVEEIEFVTLTDANIEVVDMPAVNRGSTIAYCDAPGPLEASPQPTYIAIAPGPASEEGSTSFYCEYNATMLHLLALHEAVPGHALQLEHARRAPERSSMRAICSSGVLCEGWAMYAEEEFVHRGFAAIDSERGRLAIKLQELKMQARMAINAILDVRVHSMDMTNEEGMQLMEFRGFQETAEAAGKWRRCLLSAGQLSTYFVGYRAIRSLFQDLRVLHPDWSDRALHDLVLSQGSLGPRHIRARLGL